MLISQITLASTTTGLWHMNRANGYLESPYGVAKNCHICMTTNLKWIKVNNVYMIVYIARPH